MRKSKFQISNFKKTQIVILFLLTILLPQAVFAQDYCEVGGGFIKVPCVLSGETGPAGRTTFGGLVTQIINVALLIVGALTVIFLIWGGGRYITARGNEEQAEDAKKVIKNAILGMIIVIFSFAVVNVIARALILGSP